MIKKNISILTLMVLLMGSLAFPMMVGANEVTIQFATWTYDLEKVRDNVRQFEEWTRLKDDIPNTNVQIIDFGFAAFRSALTTRFMAGAEIDVLYGSDAWLGSWALAGFVAPLEDYAPWVIEYKEDMVEYMVDSLTYQDKLYGLIYYADHMQFVYNEKMLQAAGIEKPPQTWEEVVTQSRTLKEQGITEEPLFIPLSSTPWLDEVFYALVYSLGGSFFDEDNNPKFGSEPAGEVYDALVWIVEAFQEGIISERTIGMQVVQIQEIFKDGVPAFVVVPSYMLAEFQNELTSQVAGDAKLAMMPGISQATTGFSRSVLLGSNAARKGGDILTASIALVEFLGGKVDVRGDGEKEYHVPKRWATENLLGFGYLSMWEDEDIIQVTSKAGDLNILRHQREIAITKEGMEHPWYSEWIDFFRAEIQNAILGIRTPEVALRNVAANWNELKREFTY